MGREIHALARLAQGQRKQSSNDESAILDVEQIKALLPHSPSDAAGGKAGRYRAVEGATGYKAVSIKRTFVSWAFPARP